ncbi:hypothetical protein GCM10009735_69360 [Actinomadura chokoriensis]
MHHPIPRKPTPTRHRTPNPPAIDTPRPPRKMNPHREPTQAEMVDGASQRFGNVAYGKAEQTGDAEHDKA